MSLLDVIIALGFLGALGGWGLAARRAEKAEKARGVQASVAASATKQLRTAFMQNRAAAIKYRRVRAQNGALAEELEALRAEVERLRALVPPEAPELTEEQRKALWDSRCAHCGGAHLRACPRVKRIRFRGDGNTPLEVEFWQDGQWPTAEVTWLEDLAPVPNSEATAVTVVSG